MLDKKLLEGVLRNYYQNRSEEWVQLNFSPSGLLNITVVSDVFEGMSKKDRLENLKSQLEEGFGFGFVYLFTVFEADELELFYYENETESYTPKTWGDLASVYRNNYSNAQQNIETKPAQHSTRTVTFYSYKGGVGRTTALVHVANILAKRGNKVLLLDLDLEAPSLHMIFNKISPIPQYGAIDYFYERAYSSLNHYQIHISDIIREVHLENTPGRLFVIQAGKIDFSYVSKVDDLRVSALQQKNVWEIFKNDAISQLHPDVILIDSRTGINEWGAFSLLEAADDVILFMYPNEENFEGLRLISEGIRNVKGLGKNVNFVLTKVPSNKEGKKRAEVYWERISKLNVQQKNRQTENDDEYEIDEAESEFKDLPLIIHYNADVALSETYPIDHLTSVYAPVANLIDEETEQNRLRVILSGTNRWDIIESLEFETVDAKDERNDLSKVFQKTSDFDKFVDENTVVVHGQKGTGKTALYWMLLVHFDQCKKLSKGRLDKVLAVSGHGPYSARPGKEEYRYLDDKMGESFSWETYWRAYSVLRLYIENKLPPFRRGKFSVIYDKLKLVGKNNKNWTKDHTVILLQLINDMDINILIKDYLIYINDEYSKRDQSVWLLYDDLDEDIQERSSYQSRVLAGLFYFIRSIDGQKLSNIKFKVFIREDIWERLNFTNKSHFNGRDVLLQWSRIDFLRLALRQSLYSRQYKEQVDKFFPIQDIDNSSEESVLNALQILWGMRREKSRNSKYVGRWVHERLTDASGTTFPRVLGLLLSAAKEHELQYIDQSHVPSPTDRLLRSQSLNVGLISAAKHRSSEIKEEYPELENVFSRLHNFPDICTKLDLESLFNISMAKEGGAIDDFITTIKNIGLAKEDFVKGEIQYRFADMYVHGFGMKRSHGRKL
ncbi:MinD/ParA family ATP-binding protein [Tumebacillus permanentifrigoris]|uniref:AAA domain-containing protein n=1 Tax=Tumebacillus permanentifrigoris TaxID=378543 RepID=A0A316DEZ1_9BACL|nr:AAA family ATPase [Tumebacillus permanentifrigoris]PWK16525.1 AAA domain-containing protein [Tumebacillus permanentifrigoris]